MVRLSALLALVAILAVMLVAAPNAADAITCGQVVSYLSPCIAYVRNGGPIPNGCCDGVRGLVAAAKTTPDRQTACNCVKNAAAGISGLNPGLVAGIPGKCVVSIPYAISPSTDCSNGRFWILATQAPGLYRYPLRLDLEILFFSIMPPKIRSRSDLDDLQNSFEDEQSSFAAAQPSYF
ncbi:putative Non-specific lipid-transfer protein [Cocos nucifera]|nr:putative Non-specific lipid-transfer protein [Cocos nucifera]